MTGEPTAAPRRRVPGGWGASLLPRGRVRLPSVLILECLGHVIAIWVMVTWVWQFLPTFTTKIQGVLPVTVDSVPALTWRSQIQITLGGGTVSVPGRFWGPMRLELTVGTIQQEQARALGQVSDLGQLVEPLVWLSLARLGEVLLVSAIVYLAIFAGLRGYVVVRSRQVPLPWTPVITAVALTLVLTIAGVVTGVLAVDTRSSISAAAQIAGAPPRVPPAGAVVPGVRIATIGDSRIGHWSAEHLAGTDALDYACTRTSDSLAAQLAVINSSPAPGQSVRAANLACTGATVANFTSPQEVIRTLPAQGDIYHVPVTADGRHGVFQIPSQSSQLQQFPDLKVIVVAFGPNDLGWTTQLGLYVAAQQEADAAPDIQRALGDLAASVWESHRSQFLVDLNLGLLPQLAELASRPAIIVLGSYDPFAQPRQETPCTGAGGLSPADLQIIHDRTAELNDLLAAAVRDANAKLAPAEPRFTFVQPRLAPLCSPDGQAAPDLHGMDESYPLHPTALGEAHIAAAVQPYVADALAPPAAPSSSTTPTATRTTP
jgi:lysophospholipase L1-like esterase